MIIPLLIPAASQVEGGELGNEEEEERMVVLGHRGSGMNSAANSNSNSNRFRENTLLSFNAAASSLLRFLEFDVQVTKDDCPVIFHDNFIVTQHQGSVVEKRVTDLTVDEFLSYGLQKGSGKVGKPLFKKTKEGEVVEWRVENDDSLCTLEEVFKNVKDSIGFDIEAKFDDHLVYKEEELKHSLQVILDVVEKHNKGRPIIFSSFHPDAARLMRQMQRQYPVFFITKGGTEIFDDPRRNSVEEAIKHCKDAGLQGIVSEVKAIFKNPAMVSKIKGDCKLSLLTYGQLNNAVEVVYLQRLMGVDGVVVDLVEEITAAMCGLFPGKTEEDGKEKPRFSERELSFLLKLIPKLLQI